MIVFLGAMLGSAMASLVITGHWRRAVLAIACGAFVTLAHLAIRVVMSGRPGPETWRDPL